jgi:hypothetical protein
LEQAAKYSEARIKRRDGQVFVVKPQKRKGTPLAVNSTGSNSNSVAKRYWIVLKKDANLFSVEGSPEFRGLFLARP